MPSRTCNLSFRGLPRPAPAHADHVRRPNVAGMDLESPGLRTGSRSWIWSSCPGRAILSVSARLTHIRAITGSQLRRTMERVDDVDQATSFIGSTTPRRSTRTLAVANMSTRDSPEAPIRIGCGALIGLMVGFILVGATLSFYASSLAILVVVGLSTVACAVLAWRFGDRFYSSLITFLRWF